MSTRTRQIAVVALLLAAAVVAAGCSTTTEQAATTTESPPVAPTTTEASERTLQDTLDKAAADPAIPGIAATVFTSTETLTQAAAGVRRNGETEPVTVADKFHLGSETKAMTAALLGRFAERGLLGFDVPLSEAFPSFDMDPGYQDVTIRQLLSHTAGIDDSAVLGTDIGIDQVNDPLPQQRAVGAEWLFGQPPQYTPGEQFMYSNVGYVMAGAAMEIATGEAWEDLISAEVFEPLGMGTCGFGTPDQGGDGDQPWGHDQGNQPVPPGPMADNPPVLGPAGTVHCSMADWVLFLQEMMRALDGKSDWLSAETAETIFAPVSDGYALGWGLYTEDGLLAYTHDGSNTMWYASVWLVPEMDLGWVVVSNASMGPGGIATLAVTRAIEASYVRS